MNLKQCMCVCVCVSLSLSLSLSLSPLSLYAQAEIQAFTSKGFQFLTETYLPRKLREGDWV